MRTPTGGMRRLAWAGAAVATVMSAAGVGGLVTRRPGMAVAAAIVAVATAVAVGGAAPILVLAFPALFVARRIGPAGLNMSGADLAIIAATCAALPFVPWRNVVVRRVAAAIAAYQVLLLITVIASPSQRAAFEWAHRASMLFGGLAVGAAVAHLGQARRALRLLLLAAAAVSIAAVLQSLASGLNAAFPLGLNKNFAGGLLAMCLIVAMTAPGSLGLAPSAHRSLLGLLFFGLLATQSRAAVTALVVAVVLWSLTSGRKAVRAAVVVPAAALVVLGVVLSLQADSRRSQSDFTSSNSRRIANEQAAKVWRQDRLLGAGLRYFKEPGYRFDVTSYRDNSIEVHNVWYSTLAESGVLGIVTLGLLLVLTLQAVRVSPAPLATAAVLALVIKLVQGSADIYWVAGTQTLPWLLVGLTAGWGASELQASERDPTDQSVDAVRTVSHTMTRR